MLSRAAPYGQGWEEEVVAGGDPYCEDNQLLHGQAVDLIAKAYENPFYDPEVADPLNLNLKAPNIDVPVFLTGQWQDEQTGPGFASLLDKFTGAPTVRLTVQNGLHPDGYAPQTLAEWNNFLSFYLREEIPVIDPQLRVTPRADSTRATRHGYERGYSPRGLTRGDPVEHEVLVTTGTACWCILGREDTKEVYCSTREARFCGNVRERSRRLR